MVDCFHNLFTSATLDALFESLPMRVISDNAKISIGTNPGTNACNTSIATNKGWRVI
jgi:hypothetical protein